MRGFYEIKVSGGAVLQPNKLNFFPFWMLAPSEQRIAHLLYLTVLRSPQQTVHFNSQRQYFPPLRGETPAVLSPFSCSADHRCRHLMPIGQLHSPKWAILECRICRQPHRPSEERHRPLAGGGKHRCCGPRSRRGLRSPVFFAPFSFLCQSQVVKTGNSKAAVVLFEGFRPQLAQKCGDRDGNPTFGVVFCDDVPRKSQSMHASAKTLARRQIERQIIEDGTAIWKTKKEIDWLLAAEDKKQQWMMLATYNPWGKPGHGAPVPGALRKTKWMFDVGPVDEDGNGGITLGRPGHGAPLRTPSGKTKTLIKADPLIRFQFHDSIRRSIENDLRYRTSPNDRESYRKELDALVCQKMAKKSEEVEKDAPCEKRKGWTNNAILNKLTRDSHPGREREQIYEITGGGVELVPLLAKHRMVTRCLLPTTDITRMSRICNDVPKSGREYFRQLCHQISEREKQKQKEQREDAQESLRHFETWKGFWGRPGHGAPKALSQREKLEFLLHRIPSLRTTSSKNKSQ